MVRPVEVNVELVGRVLLARGLRFRSNLEGRAYDIRPVRRQHAGQWLLDVLDAFQERTGNPPRQFGISGDDLLILA